jgi:hypothetical protein
MDIPIVPMAPGAQFDFTIPDWVKLLIAECVIIFGRVEQKAIEIVWVVETADPRQRVKIARRPAAENFKIAVSNMNGVTPERIEAQQKFFVDLAQLRNLIAHGCWVMVNSRPWVVWHKFIVDDGSIVGEFCEKDRFEAFKRQANKMLEMLSNIHNDVEEVAGIKTNALTPLLPK